MDEHHPSQVLSVGPFHPLGPSGSRFFLWGMGGAVQCGWPHDRMPLVGIIALFWAMCPMAPAISAELGRLGARALVLGPGVRASIKSPHWRKLGAPDPGAQLQLSTAPPPAPTGNHGCLSSLPAALPFLPSPPLSLSGTWVP